MRRFWEGWLSAVATVILVALVAACTQDPVTIDRPVHHHHAHEPEAVAVTCVIPHAEHPGWRSPFSGTPTKKAEVEAAKAIVGERKGEHPLSTLQLLVDALKSMGECAAVSVDGVFIALQDTTETTQGFYEEWHSVEYKHGGWTGHRAFQGTWYHTGEK